MRTNNIIEAVAQGINSKIANKEEESFEAIESAKNETNDIYKARRQAHEAQVSDVRTNIETKMEAFKEDIDDIGILMEEMVASITNDGEELSLSVQFITSKKEEFKTFVEERNREVSDILQAYQDSFTFESSN
jgi:hypothetical protein